MRASVRGSTPWAAYSYGPTSLAAGATFKPPAKTIIQTAYLNAGGDLDIRRVGEVLINAAAAESGLIGSTKFDGSIFGYTNGNVGDKDIILLGWTLP